MNFFVDGKETTEVGDTYWNYDSDNGSAASLIVKNSHATSVGGYGSKTDVYVDDNEETVTFYITYSYLGLVQDVDDGVAAIDVYYGSEDTLSDLEFESDEFEEGEYVYLTLSYDGSAYEIVTANLADCVQGVMTLKASSYIKIDGVNYNLSQKYILNATASDFISTFNFYLDGSGNVVGSTLYSASATSLKYLYVTDSVSNVYGALSGAAYVKAAVTFTDGTSDVINLYVKNSTSSSAQYYLSGSYEDVDVHISDDAIATGFYSYKVTTSGYYYLSEVSTVVEKITLDGGDAEVIFSTYDSGESEWEDISEYATSKTTLTLMDAGVTYIGYGNFPDYEDGGTSNDITLTAGDYEVLYVLNNVGTVAAIYIYGDSETVEDITYACFITISSTSADGYYGLFYANGGFASYLFATTPGCFYGTVYKVSVDNDGYATAEEANQTTGTISFVDDEYIILNGTDYYSLGDNSTDCDIYNIDTGDGAVDTLSIGDEVLLAYEDDVAYAIFIID